MSEKTLMLSRDIGHFIFKYWSLFKFPLKYLIIILFVLVLSKTVPNVYDFCTNSKPVSAASR